MTDKNIDFITKRIKLGLSSEQFYGLYQEYYPNSISPKDYQAMELNRFCDNMDCRVFEPLLNNLEFFADRLSKALKDDIWQYNQLTNNDLQFIPLFFSCEQFKTCLPKNISNTMCQCLFTIYRNTLVHLESIKIYHQYQFNISADFNLPPNLRNTKIALANPFGLNKAYL